jgi:hypothetical protein
MRIIGVVAVLVVVSLSSAAEALPKRQTPGQRPIQNTCSQSQLNSPMGRQCLEQADQDMMNGSQNYHYVYCNSAGVIECCMTDGYSLLDHSCTSRME